MEQLSNILPKVTPKGQQGLLKVITNITTNKYTQHRKPVLILF